MSEAKEAAKVAKKERKLAVKQAKKQAEASPEAPAGPTPAERSAAAAERQVRLQRLRVVLAFLGVAVAAAMLLWTVKPWRTPPPAISPTPQAPAEP
jgi:ferric-dicitrate binding protein FerR (iron transport regulator)